MQKPRADFSRFRLQPVFDLVLANGLQWKVLEAGMDREQRAKRRGLG